jgi:hypothetical protein
MYRQASVPVLVVTFAAAHPEETVSSQDTLVNIGVVNDPGSVYSSYVSFISRRALWKDP